MNFVLKYIELILAAAGILMMFVAPYLVIPETLNLWKFIAISGVIITIVHGILKWIVRRCQRNIRREVIKEVKVVLQDRTNNNLTKISMGFGPFEERNKDNGDSDHRIIHQSIKEISA